MMLKDINIDTIENIIKDIVDNKKDIDNNIIEDIIYIKDIVDTVEDIKDINIIKDTIEI